jgi:murein L,D-transpeptidase YcbB/YkuD
MTRRALIVAFALSPLRADDAQQIWDLFTQLAAALSEGNADTFLRAFDRTMPGYEGLRTEIAALLAQSQVKSSIELLSEEGDDQARAVELDWFLEIVGQQDSPTVTRRRERIQCRVVKQRKKWRITALGPISFFAPPKP